MRIGEMTFERGIFLAPMEDISDRPFRRMCRHYGADLVYTEFVSAEGLIRSVAKSEGKTRLADDEHPVGIQIYGNRKDGLVEAARICEAAGPDLIDINVGCPSKSVTSGCAGSALMREPERAQEIFQAVGRAVEPHGVPFTVKMRTGWDAESRNAPDIGRRAVDAGA